MSTKKTKQNGDWLSWALIVFFFIIGATPVALILLFWKLFAPDSKRKANSAPPLRTDIPYKQDWEQDSAQTARQAQHRQSAAAARAQKAAQQVVRSPAMKSSTARILKLAGVLLTLFGLAAAASPADMVFAGYVQNFLWDLIQCLAVSAAGGGMLLAGISMDRSLRRYARYLAVIGDREAMALEELSRKLGYSAQTVERDLQRMIEKGYFGGQAYLNMELGYFLRSSAADAELERRRSAAQKPEAPREAEEGYSGILRNIRRVNDRIADPELSAKIDQLESITAKIFRAVEEDPRKRSRIDTFLNYYLPTTQKLLDSYAEFESTGIEGENLRQAKQRIQTTMDSIVSGFAHQLDELYKADAMDVDSDIRVMETMLHRDTASVERDFGVSGKKPAPAAETASVPPAPENCAGVAQEEP